MTSFSQCHYCHRRGVPARGLARQRRQAMFMCERCVYVSGLLYNADGTRTNVFLEDEYAPLVAAVQNSRFRKRVASLRVRWSKYCDFCELVGRHEELTLRGDRRICARCNNDIYRQMRRAERRNVASFPGVTVRDYGFLADESFVQPGRSPWSYIDYRIVDGYIDRCASTFFRKMADGLDVDFLHGADGLRITFTIGSRRSPLSGESRDVVATPPAGVPVHDLPVRCCFCRQQQSLVPGLGVSKRTGAIICYECLLMGHDAFRADGAIARRRERENRRSPVRWVDADTYRPQRSNACEGVRLTRIALPQKHRMPHVRG